MGLQKNNEAVFTMDPESSYNSQEASGDRAWKKHHAGESGISQELVRLKLTEFVTDCLNREERLVITLRFCEELTVGEIAATLDLPESRVLQILNDVTSEIRKRFIGKAGKGTLAAY